MSTTIYSFDVFDTCITRPYLVPTDMFRDLAMRTVVEAGIDASQANIEQLQNLRINAEIQARHTHVELEDISLDQIYQCLSEMVEVPVDPEFMKTTEIALELESCSPISSVLQEVTDARHRGKIVYISDMYLSSTVIREMLSKCGFWKEGDSLYVSNEVGKTKNHSTLYHHVAKVEGVSTSQIHHLGDNKHSDVRMARITGVKARLFVGGQLTSYENHVLARVNHDAVRKFIGLNRSIRLCASVSEHSTHQPPASIVHSVIAPFLVAFVAWILRKAKENGNQRLYFVSRDAQILYKIAKIISSEKDALELRYLYGSRKAWLAPSLQSCDRNEIKWAYESIMQRTPKAILRRLDLDAIKFVSTLRQAGFTDLDETLDDAKTDELMSVIERSDLCRAAMKIAKVNRSNALGYFEQEGMLENCSWSLVDIGWRLNCQKALRHILQSRKQDTEVCGYYLGVTENHVPLVEAGNLNGYFTHSRAEISGEHQGDWIFHQPSIQVLEHLFTPATHGTVLGYTLNTVWQPILKELSFGSNQKSWIENFHCMIEGHAQSLAQSKILDTDLEKIMPAANHLAKFFLSNPEKDDVAAIAWLKTNAELSHFEEYERSLASPFSVSDLFDILRFELTPIGQRQSNSRHTWLSGSAALSGFFAKNTFYFLRYLKRFNSKKTLPSKTPETIV